MESNEIINALVFVYTVGCAVIFTQLREGDVEDKRHDKTSIFLSTITCALLWPMLLLLPFLLNEEQANRFGKWVDKKEKRTRRVKKQTRTG